MKTTLEQAATWVAAAGGKCWPQERDAVVSDVNAVRELIYDIAPSMVWDVTLCVPVRQFTDECGCPFQGFTLPSYAGTVIDVWSESRPLPQTSRWAIYPYDREEVAPCGCGVQCQQVQLIGDDFPLLADPAVACQQLIIIATSPSDAGKVLTVRYVDSEGLPRTENVVLTDGSTTLANRVKSIDRSGVSLPMGLHDKIVVRDCDGTTLAEWMPGELVPGYRRYRLTGSFVCGQIVSLRAERRRAPVADLADPVETDQRFVWEDGIRHLILHAKTNADAGDIANAGKYLDSFKVRLEQEIRRRFGRTPKMAIRFQGNIARRSRLHR